MAEEVIGRGTRCVNDKGQVAYVNDATAQNKHWQRSTGYKPKPLPVIEDLPKLTTVSIPYEPTEPVAEVEGLSASDNTTPKAKGRPAKQKTN